MRHNYRLIVMALIVLCISQVLAETGGKAQLEYRTSVAWDAVMRYLSWKKHWYETVDCESCYNALIGKNIPVSFIYIPGQSKFAQRKSSLNCDYMSRSESATESMLVIVGDTILQYNVVGELSYASKPNATIIPLDSDVNNICLPVSDNKHIEERYKEDPNITIYKKNKEISKIESYKIPSVVNKVVIKAVRRTMMNYMKSNYLKKNGDNLINSTHKADIANKGQKRNYIYIGRFGDSDPALLVYCPADNSIYQLVFPSPRYLDNDYCLEVYNYEGIGRDSSKIIKKTLINKVLHNGIKLELKME